METTVILRDYKGRPTEVNVPANCKYIEGIILSGDMVMTSPFYKDSSNCRVSSYYDGKFCVERKNFEKMNQMTDSYDIQQLD